MSHETRVKGWENHHFEDSLICYHECAIGNRIDIVDDSKAVERATLDEISIAIRLKTTRLLGRTRHR